MGNTQLFCVALSQAGYHGCQLGIVSSSKLERSPYQGQRCVGESVPGALVMLQQGILVLALLSD